MNNQLHNKRIPTIFGVGLIILGIVLTTIILNVQTNLKSKASNSEAPQNIKITNVSDFSFTITYQTEASTTGSVSYGKEKELGNTELDELDKEKGSLSPKNIHSITIKKLLPKTKYLFAINSGQNTFLNKGSPFEIATGPNISSASAKQIKNIKGKILLPNGAAPDQGIIYLSSENSQLLSAQITKDGEFNLSLDALRTEDLSSYFQSDDDTVFKIIAMNHSLKSTVLLSAKAVNSIPIITLSNDYDFVQGKSIEIATRSAQTLGFPLSTTKATNVKPEILTPKKDQTFTDEKPQFRGTSLPNEKVEIIIHSDEAITTQITADSNGNWTYSPSTNLSPGVHTITIKTRDSSGILTTLTQSFTVFASEIPTPIPTVTLIPLPSPTIAILETITPMPIGSGGDLPPTGSSSTLLIIGGILAAVSGAVLFLLTHTLL